MTHTSIELMFAVSLFDVESGAASAMHNIDIGRHQYH
jgi:hypothetical protein